MKAYLVKVETTSCLGDTTYGPGNGKFGKDPYRDCRSDLLYVVTDDPRKIYDEFPLTVSVEEVGVGYHL